MSDRAAAICAGLLNAVARQASWLVGETVPTTRGVYLWPRHKSGQAVYVGSAVGEEGLWKRIVRQHLNASYRMPDGKEKSVFRKAVAADVGVKPGEQCVDVIQDRFSVAFLACPGDARETIHEAEAASIRQLQPKYNTQGR
jgi:hypothetical protein